MPERAKRDEALKIDLKRIFDSNFCVYGVRKVWWQLLREGFQVARCTVERLMRQMGLKGAVRGRTIRTTIPDKSVPCPLDHVKRQFHAPADRRRLKPSVGSARDSYDNALAETIDGLYKAELIYGPGPWRSFEAVEFATLQWIDWLNNRRMMGSIGNLPPAEAENRYHASLECPAHAA